MFGAKLAKAELVMICLKSILRDRVGGRQRRPLRVLFWMSLIGVLAAIAKSSAGMPASCPMNAVSDDPDFAPGKLPVASAAGDQALAERNKAMGLGNSESAAERLTVAVSEYRKAHDAARYCDAARCLAGAYQAMGNYRLAYPTLARALLVADARRDDETSMRLCTMMGSVLTFSHPPGDDSLDAGPFLDRALTLARQRKDVGAESAALIDQGTYQASLGRAKLALATFADAATKADSAGQNRLAACARCDAAILASHSETPEELQKRFAEATNCVEASDDSVETATRLISLGRSAQFGAERAPADLLSKVLLFESGRCYQRAIELGANLHDPRTLSFAWGYLGNLYEVNGGPGRLADALTATRRARFFAQSVQRNDVLYRWEWQSGRILARQGDNDAAITAYQRALSSLQTVRDDVAIGSGTDFRKSVGPMFYELADLLLQRAGRLQANDSDGAQQSLEEARSAVESLKATELKNYFQDECVHVAASSQQDVDAALTTARHTAVLYVIPLADRTELLMSLPPKNGIGRPVLSRAQPVAIGRDALYAAARQMRYDDEDASTGEYAKSGAIMYDWLIRPIASQLADNGITTLVFVPDGDLRLISPAALYDSKTNQFLVQSFAIAVTPGLTLASPEVSKARGSPRVLAAGLSQEQTVQIPGEEAQTFDALPGVHDELQALTTVYGPHGKTLSNVAFDQKNLDQAMGSDQYAIVHLATHAQFNQDARKTFVLAHDGPMDLNRLEQLIEPSQFRGQPVELLSLSACETAAGDDTGRAALGLAGVAIRAGARSALATLWLADDAATSRLVPIFYRELSSGSRPSKAEALQRAQVEILTNTGYSHPRFWAPFLIIGNWR
jgi:CHAT domain-containing protein